MPTWIQRNVQNSAESNKEALTSQRYSSQLLLAKCREEIICRNRRYRFNGVVGFKALIKRDGWCIRPNAGFNTFQSPENKSSLGSKNSEADVEQIHPPLFGNSIGADHRPGIAGCLKWGIWTFWLFLKVEINMANQHSPVGTLDAPKRRDFDLTRSFGT